MANITVPIQVNLPDDWIEQIVNRLRNDPEFAQSEYRTDEWCTDCKEYDQEKHCCSRWNRVIRTALQEAQLERRKKGKWIYTKKRLIRGGYVDASECSVCNKRIMPHLKPNFCPNCGAKMEVEE